MSLALLTFGLLCACPTQAQTQGGYPGGGSGGGYPGGGGWQLDHYECTGADTWTDGAGGHANSWPATTAAFLLQFGHQYGSPDQSVGMVTTVFIWQGTGQPTDKVYTLISSYADAAGTPFGPLPTTASATPEQEMGRIARRGHIWWRCKTQTTARLSKHSPTA